MKPGIRFLTSMFCAGLTIAVWCSSSAHAAEAPDFPPGAFSDQGKYHLSDFRGKAVVLFFYEQDCPTCRGGVPERNKVIEAFKDKPVKFIAIAASDSLMDAISYVKGTKMAMPAFADSLGVMEARYGEKISLQNIHQCRFVGPDGSARGIGFNKEDIESAIADVKWKYKEDGQDPRVARAVEMLEWNQYDAGMKTLRPLLKNKQTAEQAQKVYDKVRAEATAWAEAAGKAVDGDPITAHDLYTRVLAAFPDEDLGKQAKEALATLKKNKTVLAELDARRMFDQLDMAFAKAKPTQKAEVAGFCQSIAKRYKGTPTGAKAQALAEELAKSS
jgi:thiol-disulfide isomerase/thioredoxin